MEYLFFIRGVADNPPFWPGEWGGGGRYLWDGRFPSTNSEPSLSAQLPTGASANRSRVLIPTFLQPSPAATPGLGTSTRGRQSAPSCLPEEWWAERRVVREWGRTDYSGEPPPEAEGALALGAGTEQPRKHSAERAPPAHPPPRALLTAQIAAAQALPASTPAPEGAHRKACSLWEVLLAPGRKGLHRPQLPAQCLEGNQEQGKNKGGGGWGGWGHPVSPPRAGPLWSAE